MRTEDDILREALQYEVAGKRKRGRLKRTWRQQDILAKANGVMVWTHVEERR